MHDRHHQTREHGTRRGRRRGLRGVDIERASWGEPRRSRGRRRMRRSIPRQVPSAFRDSPGDGYEVYARYRWSPRWDQAKGWAGASPRTRVARCLQPLPRRLDLHAKGSPRPWSTRASGSFDEQCDRIVARSSSTMTDDTAARPGIASAPMPASSEAGTSKVPGLGWALGLVVAAQFVLQLDSSIVNIALPTIKRELHFAAAELQWIVTGYALTFGSLLLLGGRVGDRVGHRRVLLIGLDVFAVTSLVAGFAPVPIVLIVSRFCQGASGAFVAPQALAIITELFAEGPPRTKALGVFAGVTAAGASAGVVLGGICTEFISWRAVFLVNPPIIVVLVIAIRRVIPAHARRASARLDVAGPVLADGVDRAAHLRAQSRPAIRLRERLCLGGTRLGRGPRGDLRRYSKARKGPHDPRAAPRRSGTPGGIARHAAFRGGGRRLRLLHLALQPRRPRFQPTRGRAGLHPSDRDGDADLHAAHPSGAASLWRAGRSCSWD